MARLEELPARPGPQHTPCSHLACGLCFFFFLKNMYILDMSLILMVPWVLRVLGWPSGALGQFFLLVLEAGGRGSFGLLC